MADMENHDENIKQETAETDTIVVSGESTVNTSEVGEVCTIANTGNTNEILLYVDGNQGVQDLIRVALNQGLSSGEIQQQLQSDGTSITLQSLGDHAIISMADGSVQGGANLLVSSDVTAEQQSDNESGTLAMTVADIEAKTKDMNNLFQLANLSGALSSEMERSQSHDLNAEGENEQKVDVKSEVSHDSTVIEDYIIANVYSQDTEKIPGEFNVGDAFYSLEEVEEALRLYEEKHDVKLYKRDVRSLEALLKRSLKLQKLDRINESLKYGQLLYCCVYGGKRRAQKIACMDESGIARYTDCKMFIRFAISDDGMKLVVNGKLEGHNHEEVVSDEQNTEPLYVTNTGNADEIRLGAGFVDLEELYVAIHKYETDNHVHLWRRDGRTVEALAKRAPGTAQKIMDTNPGLRFAELRFCCSYGGRHLTDNQKEKMRSSNCC